MPSQVKILGLRLDCLSLKQALECCRRLLKEDKCAHIVTLNGEIALLAVSDNELKHIINTEADLVLTDSTNIYWASNLREKGAPEIIAGVDLVSHLSRLAEEVGASIYLLGGKKGIAAKTAERLKEKFPKIKVAGFSSADPDNLESVELIKAARPDILFVAYGAPTQEKWISKNKNSIGVKISVGVGGAFDMISGVLPRAPQIIRNLHLEWFWRLILEPRRLKRIWRAVIVFPWKVLTTRKQT